jgi:hypothetical protein
MSDNVKRQYPQEWLDHVPAEVFGCLRQGELRITLMPGVGHLDGGAPFDVPIEQVPAELRMPNTRLWLQLGEDLQILRAWRRDG